MRSVAARATKVWAGVRAIRQVTHISTMGLLDPTQMQSDLSRIHAFLEDDDVRILDMLARRGQWGEGTLSLLRGGGGRR